jgi:hypothetical protein
LANFQRFEDIGYFSFYIQGLKIERELGPKDYSVFGRFLLITISITNESERSRGIPLFVLLDGDRAFGQSDEKWRLRDFIGSWVLERGESRRGTLVFEIRSAARYVLRLSGGDGKIKVIDLGYIDVGM